MFEFFAFACFVQLVISTPSLSPSLGIQFKQLMNLLDPYEGEEEEDDADATAHQPPPSPSQFQSRSLTAQEHVSLPDTFGVFSADAVT